MDRSNLAERRERKARDLEIAIRLSGIGDFRTLKSFCENALKRYPREYRFWHLLGVAHTQLENFMDAKTSLLKSYRLNRGDKTILASYLEACFEDDDEVNAFKILEEEFPALEGDKQMDIIHFLETLADLGRFDPEHLFSWLTRARKVELARYLRIFQWIRYYRIRTVRGLVPIGEC